MVRPYLETWVCSLKAMVRLSAVAAGRGVALPGLVGSLVGLCFRKCRFRLYSAPSSVLTWNERGALAVAVIWAGFKSPLAICT